MRSTLLILVFCSVPAIAQVGSSNPALLTEQSVANALGIQQTFAMPLRAENVGCVPMVMMGDPQIAYIDPREGHAPAWQPERFHYPPAFEAHSSTAPDALKSVRHRTDELRTGPWPDAGDTTKRIAASSRASASETVRQWSVREPATIERPTQQEVTVNGRTYREFSADAYIRNMQPPEPLTFGVRVIFCR